MRDEPAEESPGGRGRWAGAVQVASLRDRRVGAPAADIPDGVKVNADGLCRRHGAGAKTARRVDEAVRGREAMPVQTRAQN